MRGFLPGTVRLLEGSSRTTACDVDAKLGRTLELARVAQRIGMVDANLIFTKKACKCGTMQERNTGSGFALSKWRMCSS